MLIPALIVTVAAVFAAILIDARWLARRDRLRARRARLEHERLLRDDKGYGDALAEARVMMRPSLPVTRPSWFTRATFDNYSLRVR